MANRLPAPSAPPGRVSSRHAERLAAVKALLVMTGLDPRYKWVRESVRSMFGVELPDDGTLPDDPRDCRWCGEATVRAQEYCPACGCREVVS